MALLLQAGTVEETVRRAARSFNIVPDTTCFWRVMEKWYVVTYMVIYGDSYGDMQILAFRTWGACPAVRLGPVQNKKTLENEKQENMNNNQKTCWNLFTDVWITSKWSNGHGRGVASLTQNSFDFDFTLLHFFRIIIMFLLHSLHCSYPTVCTYLCKTQSISLRLTMHAKSLTW